MLLAAAGLCVGMSAWAVQNVVPTNNGDGTYSLGGRTYTLTATYDLATSEVFPKGDCASKGNEETEKSPSGYTDTGSRYQFTVSANGTATTTLPGLTFVNSNGSQQKFYQYLGYGVQTDGTLSLTVTTKTKRTVAFLYYYTNTSGSTAIASATPNIMMAQGENISFSLGNKNKSPYYLYTQVLVYEEVGIDGFTYNATKDCYEKDGRNYKRTTYDLGSYTPDGGSNNGTTMTGFSNTLTRYKSKSYSAGDHTDIISGLTMNFNANIYFGGAGKGFQTDNTVTVKPTTSTAHTVAYLFSKTGNTSSTPAMEEVEDTRTSIAGTSATFSLTTKNNTTTPPLYMTIEVFDYIGIGDFIINEVDGFYYKTGDASTKYVLTTYDFTTYHYGKATSGDTYVPLGFSDTYGIKYTTTVAKKTSVTDNPSGLTIANGTNTAAYLQYYDLRVGGVNYGQGLQVQSSDLTLMVTEATANTVSYLFYKQGDEGKTNAIASVAETMETIEGTNSATLYNKEGATNGYRLYTHMEVFSKGATATLGTNGYATFASPYPLDLTTANMPEGLTAYKAAVSGTTVTFTLLNQTVPANTGILLQGEASGLYDIPVVASGTEVTENAFLVNTGGTTFAGDEDYYYFGLKKNTLTFGTFTPGTLAIPANKAYLKVAKSNFGGGAARELSFSFGDDETTGVETMNRALGSAASLGEEPITVNQYYDLQGRRVAQPTRGLYIVNGKKVVVK